MPRQDSFEEALGVRFDDRALLELAFVHSSYLNENPDAFDESNQRLEFLGDALLGLVVAEELYDRFPDRPEGQLTALRSALVSGETLARLGASLGLGELLLMGRGEEASGGRERPSNLAAALEALVGALFLDQGYGAARDFAVGLLDAEIQVVAEQGAPQSRKSLLQELVQSKGMSSPAYRIVDATGQDHARQFTAEVLVAGEVAGRGTGRRKSQAEQEAAAEALQAMGHSAGS